jgi:hypothetical protein
MPPAPCSYHPETDDGSFANLTALRGDFVRFKDFKAVAGGLSFSTYTVGGQATLDRVVLADGTSTVPAVFTHPHLLVACDTGVKVGLMVHDDPNGLIEFKGDAGSLTLTFPAGIKVAQTRGDGVPESTNTKITYADGRVAILHADHIQWIGQDATVSGFAAFLVPPNAAPMAGKDSQLGISLRDAALKNHLGAEVIIRGPGSAAVRQGDLPVQILPYDDVQVKVNQTHQGVATPDNRIIITLSANLTTGRVIPIAVDPAILPAARQGRLDLHYYDLINGKPVEVLFHKAASLAEILDPANGSSQPEYWVVVDPDGTVNVLVKIPHWSDHVVTLASLGELVQPSALVGIAAGVVGTLVAAVSLLTPRRRRDGL